MIKYTIILMNMLAIFFMQAFFSGDITVKMNAPAKAKQGEEITVSLTINKGSITGVGHMKQPLPAGFGNATAIEAKGAEFKYLPEDNVIKFTWISLPADQEFTVSYKVVVNADAADGIVNLGGKFSYVLNNEKQTFMVPESPITIGGETTSASTPATQPETTATAIAQPETTATSQPQTTTTTNTTPQETNPSTAATTPVENPAATTATTPAESKTTASISASRTIVGSPEAGTEFTVEINVQKDGMKGFARIQESLPAGLTAMSLDNKGGTFSFIDQKVKIIWDNLPADQEVKVSYRVAVAENASGNMAITGSFSYVENDDPKKYEIASTTLSVKEKVAPASSSASNQNPASTNTNTSASATTPTAAIPSPEKNVTYKIQICALSKIQRGTSYFESKFAISNKVSLEIHQGWKKYIVGKYSEYKEARDNREFIRTKGVENPFVTAYNSGIRITVQEALMVSNQQWVR